MATNRTPINRPGKVRLTPEIVATYRTVLALADNPKCDIDGDYDKWRAYLNACRDLDAMLGRKLWEVSVADTIGEDQPPVDWARMQPHRVGDWKTAYAIRVKLDGAVGCPHIPAHGHISKPLRIT